MATRVDDVVVDLLSVRFSRRPFIERMAIFKKGRPMPQDLGLTQSTKGYVRHFQSSNYGRYPWLTSSVVHKRLYCWVCLLFWADRGTWNWKGFANLSCLTKAAQKHQETVMHLKATIIMKTFGDCQVTLLDEQGRRDAIVHNEKVKRNRDILRRLIHCVVFLGKQELPFRGHDEGRGSTNRGNYLELLSFLAEYDLDLHHHLTTSSVFSGTSAHIQNDLICAVADVMGETIKEELRTTPFVALMLDETSDFGNTAQLSLVLRFVGDGGVKERFITFAEVTGSGRAEGVAAVALGLLEEYGCVDKLVAQCYDGAVAMASGLNEAQARVKERIPQALFVHCYAHALPLVLSQGAAKIKECKIFFSHLSGLGVYFSRSPERTKLLGDMCQKRLVPTGGNFSSKLVCTVFEKKESLKDVFDHIVEHHEDFDEAAVHGADGHMSNLGSFEFNFLLSTFNEIFAHADVLFEHLQKNSFDTKFCMDKVDTFCVSVEGQRERFDGTYDETVQNTGVPTGRRVHGDARSHYKKLHGEIVENILNQVHDRFKDHLKLSFLSLLDPNTFSTLGNTFPEAAFSSLADGFGPLFDLPRLKIELSAMYTMNDFRTKNPIDLLLFLQRKGLCKTMRQLHALACLVLTIPVTATSLGKTCSALKRIKAYTNHRMRHTKAQPRLSALASIAIEKQLILDLKTSDQLYDRVIDQFSKKDRRLDSVYKSTSMVTTIDECQTDIPAILHFETNPNAPKRSIARKPDGSKPAKLRRQRLSALECSDGPGLPTADQNTNSASLLPGPASAIAIPSAAFQLQTFSEVTVKHAEVEVTIKDEEDKEVTVEVTVEEEVKVEEDKEVTVEEVTVEEVTVEEEVKVEEDKKGTVEEVTVKVEDAEVTEEEEEDRGGREGIEEPIEEPWSASPEMPSPAPGVLLPGATVLKEADRFTFTSGCAIGRVGFQSPLDQNATLVVSLVRHQVDISTGKE